MKLIDNLIFQKDVWHIAGQTKIDDYIIDAKWSDLRLGLPIVFIVLEVIELYLTEVLNNETRI